MGRGHSARSLLNCSTVTKAALHSKNTMHTIHLLTNLKLRRVDALTSAISDGGHSREIR
jgi:hypothetical protein